MNEITIDTDGTSHLSATSRFAGGELHVKFPLLEEHHLAGREISVTARLQAPEDIIRLVLAKEVIDRLHRGGNRTLVVPYFPYARQDRIMQPAEAFSLRPIARLINSLGFDRVVICDPHSDVTPALIKRVTIIPQAELVMASGALEGCAEKLVSIIAPDAGAAKKAQKLASMCRLPLVVAFKVRDVATGEITETHVGDPAAVAGRDALIVDDICDGGRTFIELAKALRAAGARTVSLYVTRLCPYHGDERPRGGPGIARSPF